MKPHILVIGGGASGLMAAGIAAQSGARVTLFEKMPEVGRKLAITGKGRCNLTNIIPLSEFISHFGHNGKFLYQAFSRFFSNDLIELIHQLGINTVVERGGRVFPKSNAAAIVSALEKWNLSSGVLIQCGQRVVSLLIRDDQAEGVQIQSERGRNHPIQITGDAVILATGGASYPGTGSTGDGYALARSAGHTLTPIRPALIPLVTAGSIATKLQGLSLRNVHVSVFTSGKKTAGLFGEMLFTHFGVSGPVILTLSQIICQQLELKKTIEISIDLKPALDKTRLEARLLRDLTNHGKKQFQNLLKGLLPQSLIPVCIEILEIPADKPAHQITAYERRNILKWLKDFRLRVIRCRPLSEAIITAGGVSLKEINARTLESHRLKNLYFAGELLDLNADTGGYNLQAAFSTGWLAGKSAVETHQK
jgi:predicted Rossmann fold flavoprotein